MKECMLLFTFLKTGCISKSKGIEWEKVPRRQVSGNSIAVLTQDLRQILYLLLSLLVFSGEAR